MTFRETSYVLVVGAASSYDVRRHQHPHHPNGEEPR